MKKFLSSVGVLLFASACATASPTITAQPQSAAVNTPSATATFDPNERPPFFDVGNWRTDFTKRSVPFNEIISGGPPKDGIPAIDEPKFVTVAEASVWLPNNEPVILYQNNRDARAYALQILIWHEIVNDTVGGKPVVVTFCPLCNTSIVFDRVVEGQATTFGTTGKLRYSDLVMYDRRSETWWQQATGDAIVGEHTGKRLTMLPSQVVSFGDFKTQFPDGKVLSRDTGHSRSYGSNPYVGYDAPGNTPFLYSGPTTPGVLRPTDYVVTLALGDVAMAYPLRTLAEKRVVNDTLAGQPIAVLWQGGTSSALDARATAQGRDIGATGVFSRKLNDRTLTFAAEGSQIRDLETRTQWSILGQAIEGALKGQSLTPIVHGNHFWFAWAAFRPDTQVYAPK